VVGCHAEFQRVVNSLVAFRGSLVSCGGLADYGPYMGGSWAAGGVGMAAGKTWVWGVMEGLCVGIFRGYP